MEKKEIFKRELSLIRTDAVRNLVISAIERIADDFFTEEASSTGKYHPVYSLGNGGLLRHTKSVVSFANIFNIYSGMSQYQKDVIVGACILHDSCKKGVKFESRYTEHAHPMLVWKLLDADSMDAKTRKIWADINNGISTHMGQWTTSDYSSYVLPKISTRFQLLIHWADYLGSRKYINIAGYGEKLNYPSDQWKGSNEEIFCKELGCIKNDSIRDMVRKLLDSEGYKELAKIPYGKSGVENYRKPGGVVTRIKASLRMAHDLLSKDVKTDIDEHDEDIIYASIFFNNLGSPNAGILDGEQLAYLNEIKGFRRAFLGQKAACWEQVVFLVCEKVAILPSLEIDVEKKETKSFKPASEKQVNRIKKLMEEFSQQDGYDGRYDKIIPEKLSMGMAGKYISEMKALQQA